MKDSEVGETLVQACLQQALLADAAVDDYDDPVELTLTRGSSNCSDDGLDKATLLPKNHASKAKSVKDKWAVEHLSDEVEVSHRNSEPHPEPGPGRGCASSSPSSAAQVRATAASAGGIASNSSSRSTSSSPGRPADDAIDERTLPVIRQSQQAFPHPQSQPGLLHRMQPQSIVQQPQKQNFHGHPGLVASSVHHAPSPPVGTNTPTHPSNPSLRVSSSVVSGDRPVSECTLFSDYKDLDLELQQGSRRPLASGPHLAGAMRTREVLQSALEDPPECPPTQSSPSRAGRDPVAIAAAGSAQRQPGQVTPSALSRNPAGSPGIPTHLPPIGQGLGQPAVVPSISAVPGLPGRPSNGEARERDRIRGVPLYLRMQQKFDDLERQKLDFAKERRHAELLVQAVPVHIVAPRRKRQVRQAAGQKKGKAAPRRRRPKVSAFVAPPMQAEHVQGLPGPSSIPEPSPRHQACPSLPAIAKAKARPKANARGDGPKVVRAPSKQADAGVARSPASLPPVAAAHAQACLEPAEPAPDRTRLPASLP